MKTRSPPSSLILAPGLLEMACPSASLLLTAESLAQHCPLRFLLALTQVGLWKDSLCPRIQSSCEITGDATWGNGFGMKMPHCLLLFVANGDGVPSGRAAPFPV